MSGRNFVASEIAELTASQREAGEGVGLWFAGFLNACHRAKTRQSSGV
ncbi:MAG: hypothetical protein ACJASJ_000750, partial [Candidatus Azotimanducaceae bacterium]